MRVKVEIPGKGGHWILELQKPAKGNIRDKFWLLAEGTWKVEKSRNNKNPRILITKRVKTVMFTSVHAQNKS